jgi:chromosome segregation ATPase
MAATIDAADLTMSHDYQDTVALLQEEIARLEEEIRLRDEAIDTPAPAPDRGAAGLVADRRIDELTAALAERDATITLLWEEVQRFEEAEVARRAEWDQLHRWVEEVERRVEGGGAGADFHEELDAERRRLEAERQEVEAERRGWEARRRALESEVADLRARLAAGGRGPAGPADARIEDLSRRLAEAESAAAEVEAVRNQLRSARAEAEGLMRELHRAEDDRERHRREHEAELAALRSQAARVASRPATADPSPDDRLRALRDHLREIHDREEQERQNKQLASRLSRLWRRTGPGR